MPLVSASPTAEDVVRLGRTLRRHGLQAGPDRLRGATLACECLARETAGALGGTDTLAAGTLSRGDAHAALAATLLDRREHEALFDQVFDAWWQSVVSTASRDEAAEPGTATLQPEGLSPQSGEGPAQPLGQGQGDAVKPRSAPPRQEGMGFSPLERLRQSDLRALDDADFAAACALARRTPFPVEPSTQRRLETASRGRIDLRRTLRALARRPHQLTPAFVRPRRPPPALVLLVDVSRSMDRYAQFVLHPAHQWLREGRRVQVFALGTRLTCITAALRAPRTEDALHAAARRVPDWHGGTRLAEGLAEFNRHWAPELLTRPATVLLVSDGLDRGDPQTLAEQAELLRLRARRVLWWNPLKRYAGFEPRAAGLRALLPWVDDLSGAWSVESLRQAAATAMHGERNGQS